MSKENTKERTNRSLKEARLNAYKSALKWKSAFGSSDGQKCLELLKAEFYDIPFVCDTNPEVTKVRAAKRDLVRSIIEMIELDVGE